MDRETINSLIEQIWVIEAQFNAALRTLAAIESAIADEAGDG